MQHTGRELTTLFAGYAKNNHTTNTLIIEVWITTYPKSITIHKKNTNLNRLISTSSQFAVSHLVFLVLVPCLVSGSCLFSSAFLHIFLAV